MIRERLLQILSNLFIEAPVLFTFYYVQQSIFSYAIYPMNILIFALPIVKNLIPKYGKYTYPIVLLSVSVFILISFFNAAIPHMYGVGHLLYYFNFDYSNLSYVTKVMFTFFTSLPFIFIVEGMFSVKLQRILGYLVISMADLLDMVVVIQINPLLGGNLIKSFELTNVLFGLNLYTLIFFGYEFISIVFHVSAMFNEYLDISFIVSAIGIVLYFFFVQEGRKRVIMDGIATAFLFGAVLAIALSYVINVVSGSSEELFVIAIFIFGILYAVNRTGKQKYNRLGEMVPDETSIPGNQ